MHLFEACQLNPKYTLFLMHSQRYAYTRQEANFAISTPICFFFSERISPQVANKCPVVSQSEKKWRQNNNNKIVVMQQQ